MLDYKQLLSFVKVAESGSFTKAAKNLYMTQPAISWQIKSLEDEMGLLLFERKERHVLLTEAGRLFYGHARRLVKLYEQLLNEMEQFKGMERGRLIIGASTIPGEYILPAFIGAFKKEYPGVELAMQIADTGAIVELLLGDEVHLGVIGAKIKEPKLELKPFLQDELILVAAPTHPLVAREYISMDDIKGQCVITREAGSGTQMVIEEKLKECGLRLGELKISMELGSTRAVITAVEAGLGLSWVSRWAVQEALSLGRVAELQTEGLTIRRELYLAYNNRRTLSPLACAFKDYILAPEVQRSVLRL
ncbi:selenium metabolism-associated LysR family transcriptional regulator [Zhaonella formicivorans]|jgi:DNA-binding transcriptional LysR family regulator|uniref:selenium metabolism-associated LysR family transcriptional regulator n=1 Tax=Zhaonella formicivorans TaxID=2528593 RepID=UPI0010DC7BAB|nr:selenium metabolism-associated LysR family transcriptional regulator [Zhaonella formicivorans]